MTSGPARTSTTNSAHARAAVIDHAVRRCLLEPSLITCCRRDLARPRVRTEPGLLTSWSMSGTSTPLAASIPPSRKIAPMTASNPRDSSAADRARRRAPLSATEQRVRPERNLARPTRERRLAHEPRADDGQLALGRFGPRRIEPVCDDDSEHGVA
jgi:hypothetical protein